MTPEIIFEDNHVLVAVKPAGVLSQSDGSGAPDILNIIKDYIKVRDNKPGNVYLGLIHRLDRNVEGVMVFAKTSKAASRLSEQVRNRKVTKKYRAEVTGLLSKKSGTLTNYLLKNEKTNITKVFDRDPGIKDAKLSTLDYEVIEEKTFQGKTTTWVDVKLGTGRSHQIRVQFAHIGHPLVGDVKYKGPADGGKIHLQSYLIGFFHPVTKEYMEYTLFS